MKNPDGTPYPVNWATLTPAQAHELWLEIGSGNLTPEGNEMQRLEAILEQEDADDSDYEDGMREDLREAVDRLTPHFTQVLQDRNGKKLPGRKVQGDLLEEFYSLGPIGSENSNEVNANEFLMNMGGIDHVRDHPTHPFVQDKMHLSESTAKPETYRDHYRNRFKMSEKFLRGYVSSGEKRRKTGEMMKRVSEDDTWENKSLIREITSAADEHRKSVEEALEDDNATEIPDIGNNEELIEKVGNAIGFSVPSDIWEQLHEMRESEEVEEEEMKAYIRLDPTTQEFRSAFDELNPFANPMSEKKAKKDDEEYEPTSSKRRSPKKAKTPPKKKQKTGAGKKAGTSGSKKGSSSGGKGGEKKRKREQ